MRNFQRKRGWRNILQAKPVLVFLGIGVLFFAWNIIGFVGKMEITKENKKMAEDKVAELEREKEKLSSDIAKLKTAEGMEESIREKFGLAKEGENLIIVVEDEKNSGLNEKTKPNWVTSFFHDWFK